MIQNLFNDWYSCYQDLCFIYNASHKKAMLHESHGWMKWNCLFHNCIQNSSYQAKYVNSLVRFQTLEEVIEYTVGMISDIMDPCEWDIWERWSRVDRHQSIQLPFLHALCLMCLSCSQTSSLNCLVWEKVHFHLIMFMIAEYIMLKQKQNTVVNMWFKY